MSCVTTSVRATLSAWLYRFIILYTLSAWLYRFIILGTVHVGLVSNFAQIVRFALVYYTVSTHCSPAFCLSFLYTLSALLPLITFCTLSGLLYHFAHFDRFALVILHTLAPFVDYVYHFAHVARLSHIVRVACVYHFVRTVYFALIYPFTRCPLCICDFAHLSALP